MQMIFLISVEAQYIMEQIQWYVNFKKNKIEYPSNYIGAILENKSLGGTEICTITSSDYVNAAVINMEETIKDTRWKIPTRPRTPMSSSYLPELDETPEFNSKEIIMY